jgi:hypothetical protein
MSASKSGTFRLLTRSYADVYKEVTYAADINPGLLCSQLFFLPNEFIVCVAYKAEL